MLTESKTTGTENRFAEAGEGLMVYHGPALWKSLEGGGGVRIALGPVCGGVSKTLCMH